MLPLREIWNQIKPRTSWRRGASLSGIKSSAAPPNKSDQRLPPWKALLAQSPELWQNALDRAKQGPRVLIANNVSAFYNSTNLESLLAVALTLRGAQVHVLLCDESLPACLNAKMAKVPPSALVAEKLQEIACPRCLARHSAFTDLGISVHYHSQFLSNKDRERLIHIATGVSPEDVRRFIYHGYAVGEHAYAGALRYYSTGNLVGQDHSSAVLGKYLESALFTAEVTRRLLNQERFDAVTLHHGIYIPQGVVTEVCRKEGIPVSTWNVAYRKRCFIFSHGDTYHHTLMTEPVSTWKDAPFSEKDKEAIRAYLKSRWGGSQDWIYFHDTPDDRLETLVKETGLDPKKPTIGLLTNVMWDAQLHYPANAFPTMLEWIITTIRSFEKRPDLQLLIRVHPAELRGLQPSRQFVVDEIRRVFPVLPKNVFVIPPDSQVNTYSAMSLCNCVIIYGTKMGVELTSFGIPVIVAGEAWIRNKGLTMDVTDPEQYQSILDRLPLVKNRLPPEKVDEALQYANHFFMRRMIPVNAVTPIDDKAAPFQVRIEGLADLLPGQDRGLDVICDGILKQTPFVYQPGVDMKQSMPVFLGGAV